MSKRPSKPRQPKYHKSENSRSLPRYLAAEHGQDNEDEQLDPLDEFDPYCDASSWDPEAIELDEPAWDERDFYLEAQRDDES